MSVDLSQLPAQVSSATSIALSQDPALPQQSRHDAYLFLSQVKEAHQVTWNACLALFLEKDSTTGKYRWGPQERMFAVQVVGEALPTLGADAQDFIQTSLFTYFEQEYAHGTAEDGVTFLKNSTIHLLTLLFFHLYPRLPTFFPHFLTLLTTTLASSPTSPQTHNTTFLFLRLLHEISTEVSDANLRLNKSVNRLNQDSVLRDKFREKDAEAVFKVVWETLVRGIAGVEAGREGDDEIVKEGWRVVGDYVSLSIRTATAEALAETVSKGMPATDKLNLLGVLDIGRVLAEATAEASTGDGNGLEEWREMSARLLNATGGEVCKIVEDSSSTPEIKALALAALTPLLPLLLTSFASSTANQLTTLTPFTSSVLGLYKKDKKRGEAISVEKRAFLAELLKVVVSRMGYGVGEEVEWSLSVEGEEDDEEVVFGEMRKNLIVIADAIAWIDPELYGEAARSIVIAAIDAFEAGGEKALEWQRGELALFVLYGYGQAVLQTGPGAFVQVPVAEVQRAKREADYRIDYTQYPLSPLGEMMLRACRSKIVTHSHPSVSLQFWEVVVRYHDFFKLCPEYIVEILPSFLDEHGLHQEDEAVKGRCFYLFSRFIFQAKATFQAQVSGEFVSNILTRVQDLLPITSSLPDDEPATLDILTKTASQPSFFDSQLYLFEASGILISILNQIPDQQVMLLRAVINPLLVGLQSTVRTNPVSQADFDAILKGHHLIMAIGNIAKGFPDLSARSPVATGEWVEVFKDATEKVLIVAKEMASLLVIRNAARFFFNRIVATTGQAILPLIPMLIDCLLGEITFPELSELLSFLGLLVAKYKHNFLSILDTLLLPVFNRVFYFLKLPIAGTDDTIQHSNLRRAYFNFILSITSANLQEVLYSEKNKSQLQDIFQSVTHYIATDSLAPDQRFGFIVLNKFLNLWVEQYRPETAPPAANGVPPTPVPGFEQFLYSNAVKLCFEVPLKASFDYSDAQSYQARRAAIPFSTDAGLIDVSQVIGEISNLLKGLLQKRGPEFVEFMTASLLPSIQCPPQAGEVFMKALAEAPDGKQFKKFAAEWLRSSRGTP
ncbi:Exportin-T [Pseudohyphozyma bogoriensis]|nr:Exportin-T [Pseudohyphozyma bogoriensis]